MKEFELQKDLPMIGAEGIDCDSIVSLISHYACETSMDLEDEFSIDIGIGKIFIKKDAGDVMFSYSPSAKVIGAVLTGFGGKSNLIGSVYKSLDEMIKGV